MISDSFRESVDVKSEQETTSGEQSYPYNNTSYSPFSVATSNSYQSEAVIDPFMGEDYLSQYSPFADPALVHSRSSSVQREFESELTFESPFALEDEQAQQDLTTSEYTFESTATDSVSEYEQPYESESEAEYFSIDEDVQETSIEGESISMDEGLIHTEDQHSFEQYEDAEDVTDEYQHGDDSMDELSEYEDLTTEDESPFPDQELFTMEGESEDDRTDHLFEVEYHIGEEKGKTIYLKTSGVKGNSLQTGVFLPAAFKSTDRVDFILYFHGNFDNGNDSDVIEKYWSTYSNVPEFLYQSKRNCILIAPGLTSRPEKGALKFYDNNGLDNYIADCFKELKALNIINPAAQPGSIIIAGHSAGGMPLSIVHKRSNKLLSNVIECWGFDCFYSYGWDKTSFAKPFYHYWAKNLKGFKTGPGVAGDELQKRFPNLRNIGPNKTVYHQGIIEHAWLNEINNRPWFGSAQSPSQSGWVIPDIIKNVQVLGSNVTKIANDWASLSPTKKTIILIVANNPQITEQKALELATSQGVNDKSELANLIFYLRHKDYLGRKLEATDAQSLKDEWMRIFKDIVTPYLANRSSGVKNTPLPKSSLVLNTTVNTSNIKASDFKLVTVTLSDKPLVLVEGSKASKRARISEKPSVFLKEILLDATGDQKATDEWFNSFTSLTFLGRSFADDQYVHVEMAKHLQAVEKEMAIKYGGPNADPLVAGDRLLGPVGEAIRGSRKVSGTAKYSMHMFGLAVDINYEANPFIQKTARRLDNGTTFPSGVVTLNAALTNATRLTGQRIDTFIYGLTYETYKAMNNSLIGYFRLIDADQATQLSAYLASTVHPEWRQLDVTGARAKIQKDLNDLATSVARWNKRDLLKSQGILNITKEFVDAVKLDWGGKSYGDMMHFDMRNTGIGLKVSEAIGRYSRAIAKRSTDEYK